MHMRTRAGIAAILWTLTACGDDSSAGDDAMMASSTGPIGSTTDDASGSTSGDPAGSSTGSTGSDDTSTGPSPDASCTEYRTSGARRDVFVARDPAPEGVCEVEASPCGGDPAGEWTLVESCDTAATPPPNPFAGQCPGAIYEAGPVTRSGSLSVDDFGHFVLSIAGTYDYDFIADVGCLGVLDCGAPAEAVLSQEGGTASCEGPSYACSCTVTGVELDAITLEGDGARDGHSVLVGDDPAARPVPLCVADGHLDVWTLASSAIPTGAACSDHADCEPADPTYVGVCRPD